MDVVTHRYHQENISQVLLANIFGGRHPLLSHSGITRYAVRPADSDNGLQQGDNGLRCPSIVGQAQHSSAKR